MISFKKRLNRGFTIVELLIVIVVIGILAALVIVTYNGIQQKARDTERKTDINALASHIEAYNASNGNYPTLANMNDSTFRSNNMKGLPVAALQDPQWTTNASCKDSNGNVQLAGSTAANCYVYAPTASGGGACDNSATPCASYTLTATLETGGTYTKQSSN